MLTRESRIRFLHVNHVFWLCLHVGNEFWPFLHGDHVFWLCLHADHVLLSLRKNLRCSKNMLSLLHGVLRSLVESYGSPCLEFDSRWEQIVLQAKVGLLVGDLIFLATCWCIYTRYFHPPNPKDVGIMSPKILNLSAGLIYKIATHLPILSVVNSTQHNQYTTNNSTVWM